MWEFIIRIGETVIGGLIVVIVPNLLRYVRQHVSLSQALLWKIDHREGSEKDEAETLIQLRNAGKVSIDNYPISIKFNLGANIIETYCHIIPPEKKYNPLQEDRQLRKRWMRAYNVYLDPQDILQISMKSTGQHIRVPQLSVRNDSLDQSLKSVLFAADDAQFTLTKLAFKEPLQLLTLIYILSLGTFAAIVQIQQVQGNYEGLPLWILAAIVLSYLGFLSFQFGVWSSAAETVFQRRDASPKPHEQSPPRGIWDIVLALTQTFGVSITLLIVAMELTGHNDLVITLIQILFAKLFRIISALMQ